MWYKNAVIYNLDVETFMDSNGDGIGDFPGLTQRIDHLENLGVDCVWLQPFHPTPNLDDGYDITDYYAVDSRLGSLGDFADFSFELRQRGLRLIIDLVVNHTSDQHPWFQQGCDPKSPFHDFYIWSPDRPADHAKGTVFPGVQKTTWTWNRKAGAYYFHRFYGHQPDLNIANPAVRREILKIMGFWLELGVSGFRVDAAPFLIELTNGKGGQGEQGEAMYAFLREMHDFIGWRCGDAIMLAEANVSRDKIDEYFGDGDRMHMLFAFLLNQPLFLSLARKRPEALARALEGLPRIPEKGQWAQFLRGHDEIDLGRLTPEEREECFAAFGPEKSMQLYDRGVRRRLAPMLGNDRRRIEMAHSLMFSLPGSQVMRYGDEIGMGDDLSLEERMGVRTPRQWSDGPNAGFSTAPAEKLIRPVISEPDYAPDKLNVRAQFDDHDSLMNRIGHLIRARRSFPEIGYAEPTVIDTDQPHVFAHSACWRGGTVVITHNLTDTPCRAQLRLPGLEGSRLVELASDQRYPAAGNGIELGPYGYRWFRLEEAQPPPR